MWIKEEKVSSLCRVVSRQCRWGATVAAYSWYFSSAQPLSKWRLFPQRQKKGVADKYFWMFVTPCGKHNMFVKVTQMPQMEPTKTESTMLYIHCSNTRWNLLCVTAQFLTSQLPTSSLCFFNLEAEITGNVESSKVPRCVFYGYMAWWIVLSGRLTYVRLREKKSCCYCYFCWCTGSYAWPVQPPGRCCCGWNNKLARWHQIAGSAVDTNKRTGNPTVLSGSRLVCPMPDKTTGLGRWGVRII